MLPFVLREVGAAKDVCSGFCCHIGGCAVSFAGRVQLEAILGLHGSSTAWLAIT